MLPKTSSPAAAPSPTTCLSISDCKVEMPSNLRYEQLKDGLSIKIPHSGCITIEGNKSKRYATRSIKNDEIFMQGSQGLKLLNGLSIELLNPKNLDVQGHLLLKAVLKLYSTELPEMSFAANTGKESPFLEKCVMSGKYCTLLLKRAMVVGNEEVLAALSYQILPPDTQYAEIPLAAVSKSYQRKGLGSFLYNELQRRLQDVGVLTIFCWGDQESEKFWVKQGFLKVAEVDGRGKPRKLPIKPDVRRAMSIPGSATLLVSHLNGTASSKAVTALVSDNGFAITPPRHTRSCTMGAPFEIGLPSSGSGAPLVTKASPAIAITTPTVTELKPNFVVTPTVVTHDLGILKPPCGKGMAPLNIAGALSSVATENAVTRGFTSVTTRSKVELDRNVIEEVAVSLTFAPQSQSKIETGDSTLIQYLQARSGEMAPQNQSFQFSKQINRSKVRNSATIGHSESEKENIHSGSAQRGRKRGSAGASQAQSWGLRRSRHKKQVTVLDNCSQDNKDSKYVRGTQREVLIDLPESNVVVEDLPAEPFKSVKPTDQRVSDTQIQQDLQDSTMENFTFHVKGKHAIMFMNMSDDNRRVQLTKFVENLGGTVTSDGNECTHVVTGEARRTLNFCIALCAGAWVVSPNWLKASVKENRFVDEGPFVLKDKAFESKYRVNMDDVIRRAKQRCHGLLQGFWVYPTKHVQPPLEIISTIIASAGGKVLSSLQETEDPSHTIVVACEEDISEALLAAKAGLPTYTSEWLMCSIMKQDLDLTTSQFAESL